MSTILENKNTFFDLAMTKLLPDAPVLPQSVGEEVNGDHQLQLGHQPPWKRDGAPKPAVVLVPILQHQEPTVLFTVRSSRLRHHSGQIAFPGGRVDPEDPTYFDAALREAEEEIGLPRNNVDLIGYLDPYLSGTNYLVTPIVARVEPDFKLNLNPDEVSETFEVPLSFLMDPFRHELHARVIGGIRRYFYAIPYQSHYIWGVTAGIIHNLYERLFRL